MKKSTLILAILSITQLLLSAKTIHIGTGKDFPNIQAACPTLLPGDTVLVHSGTYDTYQYYLGLNGSANNWITIIKAPNENVEINGGWQFTSSSYIRIEKLTFKTSTKYNNTLLHFDHAGDCNKLSHHIVIDSCAFLGTGPWCRRFEWSCENGCRCVRYFTVIPEARNAKFKILCSWCCSSGKVSNYRWHNAND